MAAATAILPTTSLYAASNNILPKACDFTSEMDREADMVFNASQMRNCDKIDPSHPLIWAYYSGLNIKNDDFDPLEFRMSLHHRSDQNIYIRYADGEIAKSITPMAFAKKPYSWGEVAYKLPKDDRVITDILVKTLGSHSERGAAPNAHIITTSNGFADDLASLVTYSIMGGVIMILLPLSFILFFVMRKRFLLAYAASLFTVLISGIYWSGAILYIFPATTVGLQKEVSALTISLYGICQVFLMMSTFEDHLRYKKIEKIILAAGFIAVIGQLSRIFIPEFQWRLINDVVYVGLGILVVGLYLCSLFAAMRGSKVARLYSFVWAMPFVVATLRIMWGLELFHGYDKFILVSPLFMLFGEGVLGAFVVAWQINLLRNERDIAIGKEAALITLSETDSLTDLLNRRAFLDKIIQGDHEKSLIIADIDNFKAINDAYGHAIGDDTIKYVADTMRKIAPEGSLLGRLGGEEFAIIIHSNEAAYYAQKLCHAIAEPRGSGHPPVTISCGTASGSITHETEWRLLYIAADRALYTAKHNGRNQISSSEKNFAAA